MNTFKRVAPKQISFVAAVTKHGDNWHYGIPLLDVGTEDRPHDRRDLTIMKLCERGTEPRVREPWGLNDYPPIEVGEYGFGFCAHRADYDEGKPIGIGRTKFEAIAALIEDEELRAS